MSMKQFPVIDMAATGENIRRLRLARGLTVRDVQRWFGFEEPQAIYKWQRGESLPTVDNLYALGSLLDVPMDRILVPREQLHIYSSSGPKPAAFDFYSLYSSEKSSRKPPLSAAFRMTSARWPLSRIA